MFLKLLFSLTDSDGHMLFTPPWHPLLERMAHALLFVVPIFFFFRILYPLRLEGLIHTDRSPGERPAILWLPPGWKARTVAFIIGPLAGSLSGFSLYLYAGGGVPPFSLPYSFSGRFLRFEEWSSLLLVATTLTPLLEEWTYRGVILCALRKEAGTIAAIFTTAIFFAISHGSVAYLPLFLFAMLLGALSVRFGLVTSILAHGVYNLLVVLWN